MSTSSSAPEPWGEPALRATRSWRSASTPTAPTARPATRWIDLALCAHDDPHDWTDQPQASPHQQAICTQCPAQIDCALDALEYSDTGVIRAGIYCDYSTATRRDRTLTELSHIAGTTIDPALRRRHSWR